MSPAVHPVAATDHSPGLLPPRNPSVLCRRSALYVTARATPDRHPENPCRPTVPVYVTNPRHVHTPSAKEPPCPTARACPPPPSPDKPPPPDDPKGPVR